MFDSNRSQEALLPQEGLLLFSCALPPELARSQTHGIELFDIVFEVKHKRFIVFDINLENAMSNKCQTLAFHYV